MKYLKEEYWDDFTRHIGNQKQKDGIKFEDLVEDILILEYGNNLWKRTKRTYDGKKDFYIHNINENIWAECKNYKTNLSLNVLAPTIIMAELNEAKEILFFSYSPINKNAKTELSRYADRHNKKIRLYDDEQLEQIILFHKETLIPKYFHKFSLPENYFFENSIEIISNIKIDPLFNALDYSKETMDKNTVYKITYNEIFGIYFTFLNRDLKSKIINISFDSTSNDFENFLLLNDAVEGSRSIKNYFYHKEIEKSSTYFHKLFFKVIAYQAELELPKILITYTTNEGLIKEKYFDFGKVPCSWIGKTKLIGSNYEKILYNLENQLVGRNRFSSLCMYGSSGTGKTRLLKESLSILVKHGYHIINFIGMENDRAYSMLREIIYVIYEIPNDEIIDAIDGIIENCLNNDFTIPTDTMKAYELIKKIKSTLSEKEIIFNSEFEFRIQNIDTFMKI